MCCDDPEMGLPLCPMIIVNALSGGHIKMGGMVREDLCCHLVCAGNLEREQSPSFFPPGFLVAIFCLREVSKDKCMRLCGVCGVCSVRVVCLRGMCVVCVCVRMFGACGVWCAWCVCGCVVRVVRVWCACGVYDVPVVCVCDVRLVCVVCVVRV
ncbi:unnamed protein product [Toxocara canis]|uniref:Trans-sialidase n=1 Tax=Toxocara canis TaxID=6265 RepID=A0A183URX6_TOXCA|nr:unnamed protein product [Toxocara canis]